MTGTLEVLSCGEGDLKITFDDKNPLETERAKRIIQDMLRRGYALFVHGKGDVLTRVKKFDAKKGTYLIADGPTIAPQPTSLIPAVTEKRRGRPGKTVPMSSVKATVVGRSAGG